MGKSRKAEKNQAYLDGFEERKTLSQTRWLYYIQLGDKELSKCYLSGFHNRPCYRNENVLYEAQEGEQNEETSS